MPAAPILVAAAVGTGTAAAVGTAVVAAVTTATVSTAVATAVGAGVISGAITAAGGGDAGDILKSAVITGASVGIGGAAGQAAGKAASAAGASDMVTKVASSAAASGVSNTVSAVGYGANVNQALQAGVTGAAAGGLGQAASLGAQQAVPVDNRIAQGVLAGAAGGATEAAVLGQNPVTGALLSGAATGAVTGYKDRVDAQQAARDQAVAAFMQPKSPGVGTQIGDPTAQVSGAIVPGSRTDIEETRALGIDLPNINVRPAVVDRLPEIEIVGSREPDLISPVLSSSVPGAPARTPTKTATPSGAPTPSGTPTLTYSGVPQPEYGPPAPSNRTPTGTPSGGGAAVSAAPTAPAGGGGGGGEGAAGQPDRTQQILDLTGISRPADRLPGVEVTGEPELDRLPEVEVTAEPELDRLPEVEVTGTEDINYLSPLYTTTPTTTKRKAPLDYVYQNIDPAFALPFQQMTPGSSALAQALGVGDPGVSYLSKKGKERKPVWNVESLKLSDELGGNYG